MYGMHECVKGKFIIDDEVISDISFYVKISCTTDNVMPPRLDMDGVITSFVMTEKMYSFLAMVFRDICYDKTVSIKGITLYNGVKCDLTLDKCCIPAGDYLEYEIGKTVLCFIDFEMCDPNNDIVAEFIS